MARATAIIIGVDDPGIRDYHLPVLTYAEEGAEKIATYATGLLYNKVTKLIGPNATYENVDDALREAAEMTPPWETVLIVFSGHGLQKDSGMRCENDLDEHWCLHQELMVDDHLLMRMQAFAKATRVFIVADCCNATGGSGWEGSRLRELLRHAAILFPGLLSGLRKPWENDVAAAREAVRRNIDFDCSRPKAELLLIASSARGTAEAGRFMKAFLKAWEDPAARSSFRAFLKRMSEHGGKPVLRPRDSPLLDKPAFVP